MNIGNFEQDGTLAGSTDELADAQTNAPNTNPSDQVGDTNEQPDPEPTPPAASAPAIPERKEDNILSIFKEEHLPANALLPSDNTEETETVVPVTTPTEATPAITEEVDMTSEPQPPLEATNEEDEDDLLDILESIACPITSRQKPKRIRDEIVSDFLAKGVNVLGIPSNKAGMPFLLEIVDAVSTNRPLLGKLAVLKDGESFDLTDAETFKAIENLITGDLAKVELPAFRYAAPKPKQRDLRFTSQVLLKEVPERVILILDVIQSQVQVQMGKKIKKEEKATKIAEALEVLSELSKIGHGHGVAIIVPLRLNRSFEKSLFASLADASISERVDTVIHLGKKQKSGESNLVISWDGTVHTNMKIIRQDNGWAVYQKPIVMDEDMTAIMGIIHNAKTPMKPKDIMAQMPKVEGKERKSISLQLRKLVDLREIESKTPRHYQAATRGARPVATQVADPSAKTGTDLS